MAWLETAKPIFDNTDFLLLFNGYCDIIVCMEKIEAFFTSDSKTPINGKVYRGFDTRGEAISKMLDLAYCIDGNDILYQKHTHTDDGLEIIDYGSYRRFIAIRVSEDNTENGK